MKAISTKGMAVAGVLAALGGTIALPTWAGAASSTVSAVTHDGSHADTTSVSGECTDAHVSSNGPVWAYDNLSFKFDVTPVTSGIYSVTITAHGSFSALCDPVSGAYFPSNVPVNGSVNGQIQYDVQSSNSPDPAKLPAQSPSTSQGTMLSELFGGSATIVGGGEYTYTYRSAGDTYVQSSVPPYTTGDITGH